MLTRFLRKLMITTVPGSSDLMSYRVVPAVFFILTFLAAVPAVGQPLRHDPPRLLFTGDILLSREVEVELKHRGPSPWNHLNELFYSADWVGGNFEAAVGTASQCLSSKGPCFAVPESEVELLKNAGFRGLTVENNHFGDLGAAGRKQTLQAFQEAGLVAVNFENSPQFLELGEIRIALIAITTIPAADGQVQQVPSAELSEKLLLARRRANFVVVSIHWGNELMPWPSQAQRTQAAWLVEHGADLIVGHHPHVIQRPECVAGSPVFFSLGNHVFDQANPKTKEGLIADCRIDRRLLCRAIGTHTDPGTFVPRLSGPDSAANSTLLGCVPRAKARQEN
jgi:hypothetical protein